MRIALVLPLFVVVAGCGKDSGPQVETVERTIPAAGIAKLVITAKNGQVELRNGGTDITVTSPEGVGVEVVDDVARITHGKGPLRVAAPAGFNVVVRADAGGIDLAGAWGTVSLTALKGAVRVAASALKDTRVTAQTGDVNVVASGNVGGSVNLKAPYGTVELAVTSRFRGLVQLAGDTIETPVPNEVFAVRRTPGSATIFVGRGFTQEDHDKLPVDKRPGFWATGKKVSFSLAE